MDDAPGQGTARAGRGSTGQRGTSATLFNKFNYNIRGYSLIHIWIEHRPCDPSAVTSEYSLFPLNFMVRIIIKGGLSLFLSAPASAHLSTISNRRLEGTVRLSAVLQPTLSLHSRIQRMRSSRLPLQNMARINGLSFSGFASRI